MINVKIDAINFKTLLPAAHSLDILPAASLAPPSTEMSTPLLVAVSLEQPQI